MRRREFLKNGLLATTGALLAPRFAAARVGAEPRRVIVVGAGLSGLVAAYELDRSGFDVTVLEAQNRTGGRILTVRDFDDGLYAEAGAARIFGKHALVLRYVNELRLPLAPFYPAADRFVHLKNNRREAVGWGKFAEATEPVMTLEKPSLWQKIRGGNDALPGAFADRLKNKIKLGAPVVRIERTDRAVSATFAENGKTETLRGDFLISAIPFSTLRKVEIAPAFSPEKMRVIENLRYDAAARALLQTRRRFWTDERLNGFGFGDEFAEVWHSTFGQTGARGVLQTYLRGDFAAALTELAPAERIEKTLRAVEKLFPALRANFEKSYIKCWSEDAWVLGAWAHAESSKQAAVIARPENRVFFAGEHASGNSSWMQGALEAGLRAAEEVKKAAKESNIKL